MGKKIVLILLLNGIVICISIAGYVQFFKPYLESKKAAILFDCGFGMPYGCKNANEKYEQLELKTSIQYGIPILIGLGLANLLTIKLLNTHKKKL